MPQFSEKELEEQITAAGKSLVEPPPSVDELLPLLDQIEALLSKVEQSPAKSMQAALTPLMKALVMEDILKHSDVDVKVGVASCISEITRITAPDAPYDDDKMKDVFQLIVSSFENMSDISSRSYEKQATILETVAKVRSCVIMLDLECDQMIIEMFQHFLKAIRAHHSEIIFTSMETIMTLVLEESEDISPELLAPILATLKRNDEVSMPITKKLAERVIQNSAEKLKPYLRQAVKSLDTSLDDYSDIVSIVCQENTDMVGHSNDSILNDQLVEGKCTSASPARDPVTQVGKDGSEETTIQDEDPTATRSPKSAVSNGINETGNKNMLTDTNSPKRADSNSQLDAKPMPKIESSDCATEKLVDSEDEPEVTESQQVIDNREIPSQDVHQSSSEDKPVEASKSEDKVEGSAVERPPSKEPDSETVTVAPPIHIGGKHDECGSESDDLEKGKGNLISEEIASDTASKKASEGESISEAKKQRRSRKKPTEETSDKDKTLAEEVVSKNEDGCGSDSEAGSLDQTKKMEYASNKAEYASKKASEGESISEAKKQRRSRKMPTEETSEKDKTLAEEAVSKNEDGCGSDSEAGSLDQTEKMEDVSNKAEYAFKKASEGESISEAKKQRRSRKKPTEETSDNDKTLAEEVVSKNDGGCGSDSEAESLDQTEKMEDASKIVEYGSSLRREDGKKSGRAKPISKKDVRRSSVREDHGKDMVALRKSPLKLAKNEGIQEETPKMSNKRQRTPGKEMASDTPEYDENLVGSKVKVWWPKDRMFYEGVISSFDSAKKKHRVSYADGDEEVLNLKKERWEFIKDDMVSDRVQEVEHSSHDASSDMKRKKKGNSISELSSGHQKVEDSLKGKLKDSLPKSGGKVKDESKGESDSKDTQSKPSKKSGDDGIKSKDQPQKLGSRGQLDSGKASVRSKDDVAKVSSHTKQDSQRSSKSKGKTSASGKTPQSGGKTPQSSSGTKLTKSSSTKVKKLDLVKEKTGDSTKSSETAKGKSTEATRSLESEIKGGKKRRR